MSLHVVDSWSIILNSFVTNLCLMRKRDYCTLTNVTVDLWIQYSYASRNTNLFNLVNINVVLWYFSVANLKNISNCKKLLRIIHSVRPKGLGILSLRDLHFSVNLCHRLCFSPLEVLRERSCKAVELLFIKCDDYNSLGVEVNHLASL